ncbi:MAG TPA: hypothetical protein VFZ53_05415 [Polyangiaceae bacterium]
MRSHHGLFLVATAGFAGALVCVPARAAVEACSTIAVEVDDAVGSASPALAARVRRALADREGMERCARVRLREGRPAIEVTVILADGRTASRVVADEDDVLPVLDALLALPDDTEQTAFRRSAEEREPSRALASTVPERRVRDELARSADERRDPVNFELSGFTAVRAGEQAYGAGLGAFWLLDIESFLLAAGGRIDEYTQSPGTSESELRFMGLGGYRFRFGATSLDCLAGPAFPLQSEGTEQVGRKGDVTITESDSAPRLLLASHLNFRARSLLRGFVGIESEFRIGSLSPNVPDHRRLPGFMVGLALGGTVGTR